MSDEEKLYLDGKFQDLAKTLMTYVDGRVNGLDEGLKELNGRLHGVGERLHGVGERLQGVDERLHGLDERLHALMTYIDERSEAVETKLLTAFHGWARAMEIRTRVVSSQVSGMDERLALAEERIAELERRKAS